MPVSGNPLTIPAGSTQRVSGAFWGFVVLQCGPAATWSEAGATPQLLQQTFYPPAQDNVGFGDTLFTSDPGIATVMVIAVTKEQAKKLPPPSGGSNQSTATSPEFVSVTNTPTVIISGIIRSKNQAAGNVVVFAAAISAAATGLSGPLSGGTGTCSGVQIANTGTTNPLNVILGGVTIDVLAAGQSRTYNVDPNAVATLQVSSTSGTNVGAVAYYL